jgi:hypothetical protein
LKIGVSLYLWYCERFDNANRLQLQLGDTYSCTIGTSTTPVGSPALVLMDEDSPGIPSFINSQIPTQHKQAKKLYVN